MMNEKLTRLFNHVIWLLLVMLPDTFANASSDSDEDVGVTFVKSSLESYLILNHHFRDDFSSISFQYRTTETSFTAILSLHAKDSSADTNGIQIAVSRTQVFVLYPSRQASVKWIAQCNPDNEWHEVSVTNKMIHCDGVDTSYTSSMKVLAANTSSILRVGHVKTTSKDFEEQYFGCIRKVRLNDDRINLHQNFSDNIRLGCQAACFKDKCHRLGLCMDTYNGTANCDCFSSLYLGEDCLEARGYDFIKGTATRNFNGDVFEGIKFMYAPYVHLSDMSLVDSDIAKKFFISIGDWHERRLLIYQQAHSFGVDFLQGDRVLEIDAFERPASQPFLKYYLKNSYSHVRIALDFQVIPGRVSKMTYLREMLNDDGEVLQYESVSGSRAIVLPEQFTESAFLIQNIIVGSVGNVFSGCIQNVQLKLRNGSDITYVDFNSPGWKMVGNVSHNTSECRTNPRPLPTTSTLMPSTTHSLLPQHSTTEETSSIASTTDVQLFSFTFLVAVSVAGGVVVACLLTSIVICIVCGCRKRRQKHLTNKDFLHTNGHQNEAHFNNSELTPAVPLPYKPAYWSASIVGIRDSSDMGQQDSLRGLLLDGSGTLTSSTSPNRETIRRSQVRTRYGPYTNGSMASTYSIPPMNDSTLPRGSRGGSIRAPIAGEMF